MSYKHTRLASYIGYVVQAVVNNLTPLLFVTFNRDFAVSTEKLASLIALNFCIQIGVDLASSLFVDRIGYRASVLTAHFFACGGFILLSFLPYYIDPFTGILVATVFTAIGGGLLEVVISPIVEALPSQKKASQMAILHSFYCWGQMAVVLLSLLFFASVGIQNWRFLALAWASVPFLNLLLFARVPLCKLPAGAPVSSSQSAEGANKRTKLLTPFFFACIVLMLCAGATELSVSQWSSMFAEKGLGVSKTVGDLLGPCAFAAMMGIGRVLYGLFGERIKIECALAFSGLLGVFAYLLTALAPSPLLSLVGCFLAGLASALLWPGTYSLGASRMKTGGTAMFAFFAMAGDIGASAGPALTGLVSGLVEKGGRIFSFFDGLSRTDAGFRSGFLVGTLFPLILSITAFALWIGVFRRKKKGKNPLKEKSC